MKNINWNEVEEAKEFKNPTAGGYAAKIVKVEDNEEKEYLKIEWDFADGEFKGYNQKTCERLGFYPTPLFRSYKQAALPFFKGFKTSVEESNNGFKFDNNPNSLVGKYVGVILGEEEYEKNDGTIGKRLYVASTCAGSKIRSGDFKVPDLKRIVKEENNNYTANTDFTDADTDEDLPF